MTRILLIEHETRTRHAMKNILESAGYEVELAADSLAARQAQAQTRCPTDLVIADRVDDDARAFLDGIPMLAVPGGRRRTVGLSAQARHTLPKPFRGDDLLAAVRVTLGVTPPPAPGGGGE